MIRQVYEQRLRFLRLTDERVVQRYGPAHASMCRATLTVQTHTTVGVAPRTKDAIHAAMHDMLAHLATVPDPCTETLPWTQVGASILPNFSVVAFRTPPADWFEESQDLGVDWEGSPPCLVQIAGAHKRVAIDTVDAPWVTRVLGDARHRHGVFGAHELDMVANGYDVQPADKPSLAECFSRTCLPDVRFMKDKSIHGHWERFAYDRELPHEALCYAALDAIVTRKLLLHQTRK